jgi:hypothetical protein
MPPQTKPVPVKDLFLDLGNFRTVKQPNERSAIDAMISTSPDRFWALTGSLLDTGYLPTDNIIVIRGGGSTLTVKEGTFDRAVDFVEQRRDTLDFVEHDNTVDR